MSMSKKDFIALAGEIKQHNEYASTGVWGDSL